MEKHTISGTEQQRIDALLDAFEDGISGLQLIIQALDDPTQSVRETAQWLLTESQSEEAKQALWDYLPYQYMKPLCTLHFLPEDREHPDWRKYCDWFLYGTNTPEITPFPYRCAWKLDYITLLSDEKILVTYTDQKGTVYLWDCYSGKLKDDYWIGNWEDGVHVVVSSDGKYLISNSQWTLRGYKLNKGIYEFDNFDGYHYRIPEPTALAIKADYTLIAGGTGKASWGDDPICVYQLNITNEAFNANDVAELEPYQRLQGHSSRVESLLLSPDETLLLSQGRDRHNDSHHLWDTQTWQLIRTYETSSEWIADCLAVRLNGQVLASGCRNQVAGVWDIHTDEVLCVLPGKAPTVMTTDGRVLVCCKNSGGLLVWDLETNREICSLAENTTKIQPLLLSRDRQLLVVGIDGMIQVWA